MLEVTLGSDVRFAHHTATALKDPAVAARLEQLGMVIVGSTPEEMGAYLKADIAKWAALVRANK